MATSPFGRLSNLVTRIRQKYLSPRRQRYISNRDYHYGHYGLDDSNSYVDENGQRQQIFEDELFGFRTRVRVIENQVCKGNRSLG